LPRYFQGAHRQEDDFVFSRFPRSLAFLALGWLATAAGAQDVPQPLRADLARRSAEAGHNQRMAQAIADSLRASPQLRNYSIDIAFDGGLAVLTGTVSSQAQKREAVRVVSSRPGVERVADQLTVAAPLTPVQATDKPNRLPPAIPAGPDTGPPAVNTGNAAKEIPPIFQAPGAVPYPSNPPKMPPYAWPTYAPYNNFSRVAYPTGYPYQAWPFIGPIYPFPKVPLGWRAVKLEWDDGTWWFSKVACRHDWWRLRYH
jgi:hypothetical protein